MSEPCSLKREPDKDVYRALPALRKAIAEIDRRELGVEAPERDSRVAQIVDRSLGGVVPYVACFDPQAQVRSRQAAQPGEPPVIDETGQEFQVPPQESPRQPREVQEAAQLELVVDREIRSEVGADLDRADQGAARRRPRLQGIEVDLVVFVVGAQRLARGERVQFGLVPVRREEGVVDLIEGDPEPRPSQIGLDGRQRRGGGRLQLQASAQDAEPDLAVVPEQYAEITTRHALALIHSLEVAAALVEIQALAFEGQPRRDEQEPRSLQRLEELGVQARGVRSEEHTSEL